MVTNWRMQNHHNLVTFLIQLDNNWLLLYYCSNGQMNGKQYNILFKMGKHLKGGKEKKRKGWRYFLDHVCDGHQTDIHWHLSQHNIFTKCDFFSPFVLFFFERRGCVKIHKTIYKQVLLGQLYSYLWNWLSDGCSLHTVFIITIFILV